MICAKTGNKHFFLKLFRCLGYTHMFHEFRIKYKYQQQLKASFHHGCPPSLPICSNEEMFCCNSSKSSPNDSLLARSDAKWNEWMMTHMLMHVLISVQKRLENAQRAALGAEYLWMDAWMRAHSAAQRHGSERQRWAKVCFKPVHRPVIRIIWSCFKFMVFCGDKTIALNVEEYRRGGV